MGKLPPPTAPDRATYDLPPPNRGLVGRSNLPGLKSEATRGLRGLHREDGPSYAFQDAGHDTWVDPGALEETLDRDPEVQRLAGLALAALGGRDEARTTRALTAAVVNAFETVMIADIVRRFDERAALVARYVMAKAATRLPTPPTRIKEIQ